MFSFISIWNYIFSLDNKTIYLTWDLNFVDIFIDNVSALSSLQSSGDLFFSRCNFYVLNVIFILVIPFLVCPWFTRVCVFYYLIQWLNYASWKRKKKKKIPEDGQRVLSQNMLENWYKPAVITICWNHLTLGLKPPSPNIIDILWNGYDMNIHTGQSSVAFM